MPSLTQVTFTPLSKVSPLRKLKLKLKTFTKTLVPKKSFISLRSKSSSSSLAVSPPIPLAKEPEVVTAAVEANELPAITPVRPVQHKRAGSNNIETAERQLIKRPKLGEVTVRIHKKPGSITYATKDLREVIYNATILVNMAQILNNHALKSNPIILNNTSEDLKLAVSKHSDHQHRSSNAQSTTEALSSAGLSASALVQIGIFFLETKFRMKEIIHELQDMKLSDSFLSWMRISRRANKPQSLHSVVLRKKSPLFFGIQPAMFRLHQY